MEFAETALVADGSCLAPLWQEQRYIVGRQGQQIGGREPEPYLSSFSPQARHHQLERAKTINPVTRRPSRLATVARRTRRASRSRSDVFRVRLTRVSQTTPSRRAKGQVLADHKVEATIEIPAGSLHRCEYRCVCHLRRLSWRAPDAVTNPADCDLISDATAEEKVTLSAHEQYLPYRWYCMPANPDAAPPIANKKNPDTGVTSDTSYGFKGIDVSLTGLNQTDLVIQRVKQR